MGEFNFDDIKSEKEFLESDFDFEEVYNKCLIDLSEELPRPEILLSIGEHLYKNNYYPTSVMTAGEISAITATSKSKKSFLKSALIACYIGGDSLNLFPNIKTHRDKDYTIADFDTEQGVFFTQRTFRRVFDMVGAKYDNYKGFATRHLETKKRLKFIDECLKRQDSIFKNPVKLVSIDGIADLVENTNDLVMSQEVSDYLMKWTFEYNIHITNVIHKSPLTNKPLGHLGTYVLKKAETVIDLEKDTDGTIKVTNPYSRGYSFDQFNFDVNSDALPYLINDNFY
jgi:hypothetical protein